MLGTRANVKVLRMVEVHSYRLVWPTEIVQWTGLSRSGVWKALHCLEDVSIIEPVDTGHGRVYPFRFASRNRLAGSIKGLFGAERDLLRRLRVRGESYDRGALLDPDAQESLPLLW